MKKIAIIFFAVVALVWLLGSLGESKPIPAQQKVAEELAATKFAEAVLAGLKGSPKWSGLQVDEASERSYKLTLLYKTMPSSQFEVERDTKAVAQAALTQLVQQGRQPSQEHIFLTVWAHKLEKGATGQAVVRVFGRALYDYNNDTIEYKRQK